MQIVATPAPTEEKAVSLRTNADMVVSATQFLRDGKVRYKDPKLMTAAEFMIDFNRRFCDGKADAARLRRIVSELPLAPENFVKNCDL